MTSRVTVMDRADLLTLTESSVTKITIRLVHKKYTKITIRLIHALLKEMSRVLCFVLDLKHTKIYKKIYIQKIFPQTMNDSRLDKISCKFVDSDDGVGINILTAQRDHCFMRHTQEFWDENNC